MTDFVTTEYQGVRRINNQLNGMDKVFSKTCPSGALAAVQSLRSNNGNGENW